MENRRILVRTKSGNLRSRNAQIVEKIGYQGRRYNVAIVGNAIYYLKERTADGNIWGVL